MDASRIHLLSFLAYIVLLFKPFQKKPEYDQFVIVDLIPARDRLVDNLQAMLRTPAAGG